MLCALDSLKTPQDTASDATTFRVCGQFIVALKTGKVEMVQHYRYYPCGAGICTSREPEGEPRPREIKRYVCVNTVNPYRVELGDGATATYKGGENGIFESWSIVPRAYEYLSGAEFDIKDSPNIDELAAWAGTVGDVELRAYLLAHLRPLVGKAEEICKELSDEQRNGL